MPIVYLAAIVLQGVFCETPTGSIASAQMRYNLIYK
jgi:hypothetical protein